MAAPPPLLRVIFAPGVYGIAGAVLESGRCPAIEFLDDELAKLREKSKGDPTANGRSRFMVLFFQMKEYGHVSPKRFGKEMGDFYAFKHEIRNKQIRFPCFLDDGTWILTHGFEKPGAKNGLGKWPKNQIERAESIRDEYFLRKGSRK